MKMGYFLIGLVVLVAVVPQAGFAQCWWSYLSGNIYNVNGGGNVGIGTGAQEPNEKLVLYNADGGVWLKFHTAFETAGGIIFEDNGEEYPWAREIGRLYNDGGTMVSELPLDGALFTREDYPNFRIAALTGNVGIGTSSPDSQLEIEGRADQTVPVLHAVAGDGHTTDVLLIDTFEEGPLFVVDKDGNVGIGTAYPDGKLHVEGDDIVLANALYEAQGRLFFKELYSSGNWGMSLVYNGNTTAWHSVPENCFGIVRHQGDADGVAALIVDRYSGNVGIGVTSPARTLHVKDVMRLEPQSSAPSGGLGDLYVNTNGKLYFHTGSAWKEVALVP